MAKKVTVNSSQARTLQQSAATLHGNVAQLEVGLSELQGLVEEIHDTLFDSGQNTQGKATMPTRAIMNRMAELPASVTSTHSLLKEIRDYLVS